MFNFFKKKNLNDIKKTGRDSSVSSNELIDEESSEDSNKEIETELSFHPAWQLPKEKEYVFRFLNNDLSPLKENQISLSGVDIEKDNSRFLVTAFLRNSLPKAIKLETAELLLLDNEKKILARKEFDLGELGEIPSESSRPWMFVFEKNTILSEDEPFDGWSLAFNISSMMPNQLDLDESWDNSLPQDEKEKLKHLVEGLPRLKAREFNILGIQTSMRDDGKLSATILFRNGNPKPLLIKQIALEFLDAHQDLVAIGGFQLNDFTIKANTSKPWTFIFPKELVQKDNPDLSSWVIRPVKVG
ncbi:MAG: accessory Sec system S-layer assembly protein [Bacillota bacterium]